MTRGSGGVRSRVVDCPVCGGFYTLTNWMSVPYEAVEVGGKTIHIRDKHVRACVRRAQSIGAAQ